MTMTFLGKADEKMKTQIHFIALLLLLLVASTTHSQDTKSEKINSVWTTGLF